MKITNPAIKTVKERLNNTAGNFLYGTHIVQQCANLRNHLTKPLNFTF